ncbi:P5 [Lilac chlorotic ringspot-associated virus]|uniref:P5 n=1 Tax=Lilac chlorotic ringspot-associated virus TaxID=2719116 RepID=A0A6G8QHM2_9VIRU|nr:P5 [Lilac chlorotic ringspot-associated virus]QIN85949.1 P5 [Lilac chlorotic ringspot-associated virus]
MKCFSCLAEAYFFMFNEIFGMISETFPEKFYTELITLNELIVAGTIEYADLFTNSQHIRVDDYSICAGTIIYYKRFYNLIAMILGNLEPLFRQHGQKIDGMLITNMSEDLLNGSVYIRDLFNKHLNEKMSIKLATNIAKKTVCTEIKSGTINFTFYTNAVSYLQLKHLADITFKKQGKNLLRLTFHSDDDLEGTSQDISELNIDVNNQSESSVQLIRQLSSLSLNHQ